jgi:hypothetical protein
MLTPSRRHRLSLEWYAVGGTIVNEIDGNSGPTIAISRLRIMDLHMLLIEPDSEYGRISLAAPPLGHV